MAKKLKKINAAHKNLQIRGAKTVHRFAHPFFTEVPISKREPIPGVGIRMTDFVKDNLDIIPIAKGNSIMKLGNILGKDAVKGIENAKSIIFHVVGDTGHENGTDQLAVSRVMAKDYNPAKPFKSPALFVHLGDVNYYDNTDKGYHAQFYEPYKLYPGKIIAIPGNHDGEIFSWKGSTGQAGTLEEFMNNFCLPEPSVPPAAGTIYRQMVNQPGVYWVLKSPFINIIGLYSNVAENPGYISGDIIGMQQKVWLTKTLKALKKERDTGLLKALVIAVHHPPFSNGGHSGSPEMLADIDDSCNAAGIMPNAVLASHSHNYQRFTRTITFNGKQIQIPFIVAGTGGRGISQVSTAKGSKTSDHTFDKSFEGYGYLNMTASKKTLNISFYEVDTKTETKALFDEAIVDLLSNQMISK